MIELYGEINEKRKRISNIIRYTNVSWSSKPPAEVYWALTEMITYINLETGSSFDDLIGEEFDDVNDAIYNKIIDYLNSSICNK